MAWDRYALAAAATQQMTFELAMRHKANIVGIASDALVEGKTTQVAVIYGEIARWAQFGGQPRASSTTLHCRRNWESESGNLGSAFRLEATASKVHSSVLRNANAVYVSQGKGKANRKLSVVWRGAALWFAYRARARTVAKANLVKVVAKTVVSAHHRQQKKRRRRD